MKSEIARFRQQQERAEQAAMLGLSGYAITSPHEVIEKRMEQGAVYLQHLMDTGRHKEAFALMEIDNWQGIVRRVGAYEIPVEHRRGRE